VSAVAAPARLDDLVGCGEPERPALTFRGAVLTYRQLRDAVDRASAGLRDLGVRRGDRVVIYLEKRLETVVALLAVARAGAVLVPANPALRARQLGHVAADCGARMLITTPDRYDTVRDTLREIGSIEDVVLIGSHGVAPDGAQRWRLSAWEALDGAGTGACRVIDDDIAAILYTSGSTGRPKGVVLTHRNLIAGAQSVAGYLRHTAEDVVLAALPLSFDAGLSQVTTTLIAGGHVVLVNYLLPGEAIAACARHGVTGLTGVPPLWMRLAAQDWPTEAVRRLRYFANTGGRMPKTTLDRLRTLFPTAEPFLMYGLTEAFRATYLDPAEVDRRPDSIGKAVPHAEVLVVRPDGSLCEPYEHGEIVQRGALVAQGYWNDPERTAERFGGVPGGLRVAHAGCGRPEIAVWSGDTAYRDEDGFLYFVGRTDEMIKTCGYRVSPTEIEEAAYATGLVTEAVALGRADEQIGQHIVLVVAGDTDERTLRTALAGALPGFQRPREVIFRDQLPRSPNGKFDRVELRRQVAP
jgi:acyl-CoA ligase (AMP-forming) (exosortase A-associated)